MAGFPIVHGFEQVLEEAQRAEACQEWCEAACIYGDLLTSHGENPVLLLRAANALWLSDQPEEALVIYRRASLLTPRSPAPFMGIGNSLRDLNRFEAAVRAYRLSLALGGGPEVACNLGTVLIGLEAYDEAFALAERRFELPGRDPGDLVGAEGVEDGAPLLRVRTEQGLGDGLQYLRWVPALLEKAQARGQRLVLEVESSLVALLEQGLAWLERPLEVREREAPGAGAEGTVVSLLSLPAALGGAPCPQPRIADRRGAYLCGLAPAAAAADDERQGRRPRIGLTWASGRKLSNGFTRREYAKRSLPQAALVGLVEGLAERGWAPVLLQQGDDRELAEPVQHLCSDAIEADGDFLATARVVAGTDLVISVDTAMAHLVGAMGHPGWVLLPYSADPRWLRERQDSPWYPSLRLFRQGVDRDWGAVVVRVLAALGHAQRWRR